MKTLSFFDTKPYDKIWFDRYKDQYGFIIRYFENKFNKDTAVIARGSDAVVVFVNDIIDEAAINAQKLQPARKITKSVAFNFEKQ